MEQKSQVYLYFYKNEHGCESTEWFDIQYKRFDIIDFYRYNSKYDEHFIKKICIIHDINKYHGIYFLFTIDYHNNFHHCMIEMIRQLFYYYKINNNNIGVEYICIFTFSF